MTCGIWVTDISGKEAANLLWACGMCALPAAALANVPHENWHLGTPTPQGPTAVRAMVIGRGSDIRVFEVMLLRDAPRGYGATAARLTPDQKVGSSNLSGLTRLRVLGGRVPLHDMWHLGH